MAPFYLGEHMKEFKITERGFLLDGVEQEIGSLHKFESMPPILVNKAVEVKEPEKELTIEVATPRRGRPPKE